MKKILTILIAIVSLFLLVNSTTDLNKATNTPTPYPTPINEPIVSLINKERLRLGLDDLKLNYLLGRSAQLKADDLCDKDYWAHTNPDGVTHGDLIEGVGYDYAVAGENLARDFETDIDSFNGFVNSPDHYALIIMERFEDIGIGRCEEYLVVHFGVL